MVDLFIDTTLIDFSYIRVTGNYLIYIDLTPVPFYIDKVPLNHSLAKSINKFYWDIYY